MSPFSTTIVPNGNTTESHLSTITVTVGDMVDERAIFKFAGAKISTMRDHLGWTAQELADRAGYSRTHITQIEGGKPAALAAMASIAHALGIPLADLLEEQRDQCRIDLARVDLDWWVGDRRLTEDAKQDLARIAKRFATEDESP